MAKATGKPTGRPSAYTPEIAAKVCEELALGRSLRKLCQDDGMPSHTTVQKWIINDTNGFAAQYARARDAGLDFIAGDVLDIADDVDDGDPQHRRLRFDARRWYLSKLAPKRYGDKLDMNVTGTVSLLDILGGGGGSSEEA